MDAIDIRLDKWLWAARVFKTRQAAIKAINGGHIQVNGNRTKPARLARVGDILRIRKGLYTYTLVILAISDYRGPASVAQTLYEETADSISARDKLALELKTRASQILPHRKKPSAREQLQARARKREQ
ncbi:RNA-binding S4 domain-containing protein [Gammaproteobacteria bacterium]|nr:RNA-binding S4 domain-containing protein [Gammaproteobacteria bacterium]